MRNNLNSTQSRCKCILIQKNIKILKIKLKQVMQNLNLLIILSRIFNNKIKILDLYQQLKKNK